MLSVMLRLSPKLLCSTLKKLVFCFELLLFAMFSAAYVPICMRNYMYAFACGLDLFNLDKLDKVIWAFIARLCLSCSISAWK